MKEVPESNGFEGGGIRSGTEIASGEGFKRKKEVEMEMANGANWHYMVESLETV